MPSRSWTSSEQHVGVVRGPLFQLAASKKHTTPDDFSNYDDDPVRAYALRNMGIRTDVVIPPGSEDPVVHPPPFMSIKQIEDYVRGRPPIPEGTNYGLERERNPTYPEAPGPRLYEGRPDTQEGSGGVTDPAVPLPPETPSTPGVPTFTEGGF
jgi:hypothetical protein